MKIREIMETLQLNKLLDKGDREHNQLMTQWGEAIANEQTEVVLTEYPRPQLARKNYTILNGIWKYAFTKEDARPVIWDGDIRVPFSPETYLSGVQRQLKPEEFLWYERRLIIDWIPMEKRLLLNFGACDERCRVYVNDTLAGVHSGGYQAFSIDITDYIEVGKNTLRLCVQDKSDTSYHGRGKQALKNSGMFYTAQSGLWQTVWCEWVPETYIQELRITPDYDRDSVILEITSNKYLEEAISTEMISCKILLFDQNQIVNEVKANVQINEKAVITLTIPDKKIWTPEHPFLYDIRIVYGEDMVESYFGMRLFTVEPDSKGVPRLCLNHLPYFQKGILDQGYYPESLLTPVSDAAMIFDIETAKAKGFNMDTQTL